MALRSKLPRSDRLDKVENGGVITRFGGDLRCDLPFVDPINEVSGVGWTLQAMDDV